MSLLAGRARPVLWVQDRRSIRENGRLHLQGATLTKTPLSILRVEVGHPRDVLWAMEEGASCAGLAAVVGEIHGAPAVLDFTATKRLAIRSEASGVPVWLIRSGDPGTLSAARERWRIGVRPSRTNPDDTGAPGTPLWEADLFRARGRAPGRWVIAHDPDAAHGFRLVSPSGDGSVARDGAPHKDAAGR
ncbi:hypothetical protein [Oceaniovalibus guishaninsula]|uniref:hypothetical protein n=1 Tax=Oceaniovalibus guishaninsula TaxID=1046117 RepID=UPI001EE64B07|nr:hypothetical protein [Oceaniovalibus guishaninsula]